MSLVINGRFLTRPMTGVDRVAENIVRGLDKIWPIESEGRFVVAVPPGGHALLDLVNGDIVPCGQRRGIAWEQFELGRHHKSAVILNLCNTAPVLHNRNIVTMHDANVFDFPASYSLGFRAWYRALLPRIARRAIRVVTVSNHSAQRLLENKVTPGPATVVSNGCDHLTASSDALSERRKMVLFAGSPAPHKNLDLFIRLAGKFETQGIEFVVAGSSTSPVFSQRGTQAPIPGNLQFLGRLSDSELCAAYRDAAVLLFPSFVEGFGLTPLEAQNFGCPVIASNRQPMLELLGSSALFADPLDQVAWEAATVSVLSNPVLAAQLSESGRANAARFTWAKASAAYLDLILPVLAQTRT